MIRLQDIADMAGVSRTTVSNVINGNTKRVSQKTIDKITAILKEQNYVPHMGSVMLSGHGSRIIGVVLGFAQAHGMYSLQDSFVGELVGTIQMENIFSRMWEWMIIQAAIRLEVTSVPAVLTKLCFLQKQILTVITAVGWALSRLWKKKENSAAALV